MSRSRAARVQVRDPGAAALELVTAVLEDLAGTAPNGLQHAVLRLLPDGTPARFTRDVLVYLAGLAASAAISEAAQAGITPAAYVDDLMRSRAERPACHGG